MTFVEIYDFIINSQDVKYINFGFTPDTPNTKLTASQKAQRLYEKGKHYITEAAKPTQLQSVVQFGEALITIVFNNHERIVINRVTSSIEFSQTKLNILAQLNDSQLVNSKSSFWRNYC